MDQRTLLLLKPDCIAKGCCGSVLKRFEEAGFSIRGVKMLRLDKELLRDHYAHIADLPFYPEVEEFMRSTPVIALVLEGEDAVARVRALLGPTDSRKAAKGTIRGDYGIDVMRNIAHASDSPETAGREIERFFGDAEMFGEREE